MIQTEVRFHAAQLGMRVTMNVLLPETGSGPFATLYLLHGLSDDHSIWHRQTRLEAFVGALPLAVVMPQGFRGFYTRNERGPDYVNYLIHDVIGTAERLFPLRRERLGRAIGGLSMGGYGALRVGLERPDLFASIASHSGAVMAGTKGRSPNSPMSEIEFANVFGSTFGNTDHDLTKLAGNLKRDVPLIRLDCGVDDYLIESNRALHESLTSQHVAHHYVEHPGAHTWEYWNDRLPDALAHHAAAMGLVEHQTV